MTNPRSQSDRVAICIATYRRPESLRCLLEALDGLVFQDAAPSIQIVVIDNDAGESARPLCLEAATWLSHPVRYGVEKRRGIPHARNAALAAVDGATDFVAFLDDDEVPAEDWLDELLRVQRETGADAVTGPCLPHFECEPPAWALEGGFFERPRHATGDVLPYAFTHNVLVRSAALHAMDRLFDERWRFQGEDREFFTRFVEAGHRIVWADEAVVYDCVPPERVRPSWIAARAHRIGAAVSAIDLTRDTPARTRSEIAAHGGWCVAKGCGLLALGALRDEVMGVEGLRLICFGVGRLRGLLEHARGA